MGLGVKIVNECTDPVFMAKSLIVAWGDSTRYDI